MTNTGAVSVPGIGSTNINVGMAAPTPKPSSNTSDDAHFVGIDSSMVSDVAAGLDQPSRDGDGDRWQRRRLDRDCKLNVCHDTPPITTRLDANESDFILWTNKPQALTPFPVSSTWSPSTFLEKNVTVKKMEQFHQEVSEMSRFLERNPKIMECWDNDSLTTHQRIADSIVDHGIDSILEQFETQFLCKFDD